MSIVKFFWTGSVGSIRFDNRLRSYQQKPAVPGCEFDVVGFNTETNTAYKILNNEVIPLTLQEQGALTDFCDKNATEVVGSDPVFSGRLTDLENLVSKNTEEIVKAKAEALNESKKKLNKLNDSIPGELMFAFRSRMHWVADERFWGLDVFAAETLEGGAVLSLRENTCSNEFERGAFHLRTGALNAGELDSKFFTGRPDGSLWWCGVQIASKDGIYGNNIHLGHGVFKLPEGSIRTDNGFYGFAGENWNDNAGFAMRRWDSQYEGLFDLKTGKDKKGNTEKHLIGKPNGDLEWNGNKIADSRGLLTSTGRQAATYFESNDLSTNSFAISPKSADYTTNWLASKGPMTIHFSRQGLGDQCAVKMIELMNCSVLEVVSDDGMDIVWYDGAKPSKPLPRTFISALFTSNRVFLKAGGSLT